MVEDRILQNYAELKKNIYSTHIDDILVVVLKGGLVGVQTEDLDLAEKIFNTIMSTALICGIPSHLVHKGEIAGFYFVKDSSEIYLNKIMHSSFRMDMITSTLSHEKHLGYLRMQISLSDLRLIMDYCKNIWNNSKNQKYLDLLINGFTLFENKNYSSAFLIFWTIIEIYLFSLWSDKLKLASVTKNLQKSLNRWYLNSVLDVLLVDKLITDTDYSIFKDLVVHRNNIIHEGDTITKVNVKKCYNIARSIVKKQIGITKVINSVKSIDY